MKNKKWMPILLMIWPYLVAGMIFALLPIESQSAILFMVLVVLLTLVIYAANIINACTQKTEDIGALVFWNMLVKLVHIPFYLVMFVIGLGVFATSWLPGLIFFTPSNQFSIFVYMLFLLQH